MTFGQKFAVVLALFGGMTATPATSQSEGQVELVVLGNVQDGGSPHIGCGRPCCRNLFLRPRSERRVVSLGLIHLGQSASVMFEATPDLPSQWASLYEQSTASQPSFIFLTHAHMGHYSGLMHLGREALGAQGVRVAAMPRMVNFLTTNGPWSQLVDLGNIELVPLEDNRPLPVFDGDVQVTPLRVPHRDEFSETVGYRIDGPNRSALFIPDIDKWTMWERSLVEELSRVDYAFVDATFYDSAEVNHRDMSEIPHPFVVETMDALTQLPSEGRAKVHFIHMNHTNPLLDASSEASQYVESQGFHVAREGMSFGL